MLVYEGEKTDVSVSSYVSRHRGHLYEVRARAVGFYSSKREVTCPCIVLLFDPRPLPFSELEMDGTGGGKD